MRALVAKTVALLALIAGLGESPGARFGAQPTAVDIDALGPQVGTSAPAFSGRDQFGRVQSLETVLGAKGAMLVFFRSADW
jgi:hypothetical protein